MEEEKNYESFQRRDPSDVTTQLVLREIGSLKELIFSEINGMKDAIKLAHTNLVKVPTDVEKAVGNLKNLTDEKFKSIDKRFTEYDELRNVKFSGIQTQMDMQEKLVTQQYNFLVESINKSDSALVKIIDQQAILITNSTKSTDDKIDDLKNGMAKLDSLLIGQLGQSAGRKDFWGYLIGGAGLIGTVIAIVGYFIIHK